MTVTSRVRASHRLLHWESDGQYGPVRAITARRGVSATYTGVSGVAATDVNAVSYTLGKQQPRADFLTDAILGAHTFAGVRVDTASGDLLSFPFLYAPSNGPLTVYVRFVKAAAATGAVLLSLGGASGARLVISEWGATGYTATYYNGSTSYLSFTTTGAGVGDVVELRVTLQAGVTNMCRLYHAVNFQSEETGSASGNDGASTLVSAWNAPTCYVGSNAAGASPTVSVFRAVMIDGGISTLASFRTRNWTMPTYPASSALLAEDSSALLAEDGSPLMSE